MTLADQRLKTLQRVYDTIVKAQYSSRTCVGLTSLHLSLTDRWQSS
jgi:hypothetical protein